MIFKEIWIMEEGTMPDFIAYASVITPLWVHYCRCYLALQEVPHPS